MASIVRKSISRFISRKGAFPSTSGYLSSCSTLTLFQPRRFFGDDVTKGKADSPQPTLTSTNSKDVINENIWAWVPPSTKINEAKVKTYQLEVQKDVLLTTEEVVQYLEANGAEKVNVIKLHQPLMDITHMVFATCGSTRLSRQFGMTISKNLKDRGLKWIIGSQGPEGSADDDWQLVDCQTFTVNLFTADARELMDLESWWTMENRPSIQPTSNEIEYEAQLAELCDRFPPEKKGLSMNFSQDVAESEEDKVIVANLVQTLEQQKRESSKVGKSSKDSVPNHKNIKILL